MTFQDLRRRVDDRLHKHGSNRGRLSPGDHARALNWALEFVGQQCEVYDPNVTITLLAGDRRVDLQLPSRVTRRVVRPVMVWIGGQNLGRPVSPTELDRQAPDWRTRTEGQPRLAAWSGGRYLMFDRPVQSDTVAQGGHVVSAKIIPAVIASDGSELTAGFPTEGDNDTGGGLGTGLGDIGRITFTDQAFSCDEAEGDPDDLGEAGGGTIVTHYPTPQCIGLDQE